MKKSTLISFRCCWPADNEAGKPLPLLVADHTCSEDFLVENKGTENLIKGWNYN
jgi:hypothetical protein